MSIINFIEYKYENATKIYAFALSIYNKSFTAGNMSIFKNLNVIQIKINKTNSW